MDDD
jgi:hypothetical protein